MGYRPDPIVYHVPQYRHHHAPRCRPMWKISDTTLKARRDTSKSQWRRTLITVVSHYTFASVLVSHYTFASGPVFAALTR
jgi:hypothetical protein